MIIVNRKTQVSKFAELLNNGKEYTIVVKRINFGLPITLKYTYGVLNSVFAESNVNLYKYVHYFMKDISYLSSIEDCETVTFAGILCYQMADVDTTNFTLQDYINQFNDKTVVPSIIFNNMIMDSNFNLTHSEILSYLEDDIGLLVCQNWVIDSISKENVVDELLQIIDDLDETIDEEEDNNFQFKGLLICTDDDANASVFIDMTDETDTSDEEINAEIDSLVSALEDIDVESKTEKKYVFEEDDDGEVFEYKPKKEESFDDFVEEDNSSDIDTYGDFEVESDIVDKQDEKSLDDEFFDSIETDNTVEIDNYGDFVVEDLDDIDSEDNTDELSDSDFEESVEEVEDDFEESVEEIEDDFEDADSFEDSVEELEEELDDGFEDSIVEEELTDTSDEFEDNNDTDVEDNFSDFDDDFDAIALQDSFNLEQEASKKKEITQENSKETIVTKDASSVEAKNIDLTAQLSQLMAQKGTVTEEDLLKLLGNKKSQGEEPSQPILEKQQYQFIDCFYRIEDFCIVPWGVFKHKNGSILEINLKSYKNIIEHDYILGGTYEF